MAKKDNVHLRLSEELSGIDAELELAMEALSSTNQRIDDFLNYEGEEGEVTSTKNSAPAAELNDEGEQVEGDPDETEVVDAVDEDDEEEYEDDDDD